jgi:hypothetical protein
MLVEQRVIHHPVLKQAVAMLVEQVAAAAEQAWNKLKGAAASLSVLPRDGDLQPWSARQRLLHLPGTLA